MIFTLQYGVQNRCFMILPMFSFRIRCLKHVSFATMNFHMNTCESAMPRIICDKIDLGSGNHPLSMYISDPSFFVHFLYPARHAKPAQMRVGCSKSPAKKCYFLGACQKLQILGREVCYSDCEFGAGNECAPKKL